MNQLEKKIESMPPSPLIKRFLKPILITTAIISSFVIPAYTGIRIIDKYNLDTSNFIYFITPGLIAAVGGITYLLNQSGPRMNEYIPSKKTSKRKPNKKEL